MHDKTTKCSAKQNPINIITNPEEQLGPNWWPYGVNFIFAMNLGIFMEGVFTFGEGCAVQIVAYVPTGADAVVGVSTHHLRATI